MPFTFRTSILLYQRQGVHPDHQCKRLKEEKVIKEEFYAIVAS